MDNKKKFNLDISYAPDFMRGFSSLILMAQNDDIDIPSEALFAISTVLDYVADDLEESIDSLYHELGELHQTKKQTVSFPTIKVDSDDPKDKAFFRELTKEVTAR